MENYEKVIEKVKQIVKSVQKVASGIYCASGAFISL